MITVVDLAGLLDFSDPNSVAVTGEPTDVEIVDLTGDGAEEICVIFADPRYMAIFENDGSGGIAQQIVVDTGDLPIDITSGDFDDDGRQDLTIANFLSSDVLVLYNDDEDLTDHSRMTMPWQPGTDLDVDWARPAGQHRLRFDSNRDLIVGMDVGMEPDISRSILVRPTAGRIACRRAVASTPKPPKYIDPSEEEDQKPMCSPSPRKTGRRRPVAAHRPCVVARWTGAHGLHDRVDPGGMTTGDFNGDGLGDVAVTV